MIWLGIITIICVTIICVTKIVVAHLDDGNTNDRAELRLRAWVSEAEHRLRHLEQEIIGLRTAWNDFKEDK